MINVHLFEGQDVENLYPVATARPAFAIGCACWRLIDRLNVLNAGVSVQIRPHLQPIVKADFDFVSTQSGIPTGPVLILDARTVPSRKNIERLKEVVADQGSNGQPVELVDQHGNTCGGWIPSQPMTESSSASVPELLTSMAGQFHNSIQIDVFHYPHDVIRFNQECFVDGLVDRMAAEQLVEIQEGVFARPGYRLPGAVVADTSAGPIAISENVEIGPFTFLRGPIFIGPNCRIIEHASIKDFVFLTQTVKAGGEIEATVIEPYTNKQHHGFLGHSYLGSWINLGAGTCNSDLKNTYGKVNATYDNQKISTDLQFVGCFIGDYSKTAINTSIFTGKSIGVCSMLYGFVATNVPDFVNYAQSFGQLTEIPADVMTITQRRMFARRNVQQRPCDVQLIHDLFEITQIARQESTVSSGNLVF